MGNSGSSPRGYGERASRFSRRNSDAEAIELATSALDEEAGEDICDDKEDVHLSNRANNAYRDHVAQLGQENEASIGQREELATNGQQARKAETEQDETDTLKVLEEVKSRLRHSGEGERPDSELIWRYTPREWDNEYSEFSRLHSKRNPPRREKFVQPDPYNRRSLDKWRISKWQIEHSKKDTMRERRENSILFQNGDLYAVSSPIPVPLPRRGQEPIFHLRKKTEGIIGRKWRFDDQDDDEDDDSGNGYDNEDDDRGIDDDDDDDDDDAVEDNDDNGNNKKEAYREKATYRVADFPRGQTNYAASRESVVGDDDKDEKLAYLKQADYTHLDKVVYNIVEHSMGNKNDWKTTNVGDDDEVKADCTHYEKCMYKVVEHRMEDKNEGKTTVVGDDDGAEEEPCSEQINNTYNEEAANAERHNNIRQEQVTDLERSSYSDHEDVTYGEENNKTQHWQASHNFRHSRVNEVDQAESSDNEDEDKEEAYHGRIDHTFQNKAAYNIKDKEREDIYKAEHDLTDEWMATKYVNPVKIVYDVRNQKTGATLEINPISEEPEDQFMQVNMQTRETEDRNGDYTSDDETHLFEYEQPERDQHKEILAKYPELRLNLSKLLADCPTSDDDEEENQKPQVQNKKHKHKTKDKQKEEAKIKKKSKVGQLVRGIISKAKSLFTSAKKQDDTKESARHVKRKKKKKNLTKRIKSAKSDAKRAEPVKKAEEFEIPFSPVRKKKLKQKEQQKEKVRSTDKETVKRNSASDVRKPVISLSPEKPAAKTETTESETRKSERNQAEKEKRKPTAFTIDMSNGPEHTKESQETSGAQWKSKEVDSDDACHSDETSSVRAENDESDDEDPRLKLRKKAQKYGSLKHMKTVSSENASMKTRLQNVQSTIKTQSAADPEGVLEDNQNRDAWEGEYSHTGKREKCGRILDHKKYGSLAHMKQVKEENTRKKARLANIVSQVDSWKTPVHQNKGLEGGKVLDPKKYGSLAHMNQIKLENAEKKARMANIVSHIDNWKDPNQTGRYMGGRDDNGRILDPKQYGSLAHMKQIRQENASKRTRLSHVKKTVNTWNKPNPGSIYSLQRKDEWQPVLDHRKYGSVAHYHQAKEINPEMRNYIKKARTKLSTWQSKSQMNALHKEPRQPNYDLNREHIKQMKACVKTAKSKIDSGLRDPHVTSRSNDCSLTNWSRHFTDYLYKQKVERLLGELEDFTRHYQQQQQQGMTRHSRAENFSDWHDDKLGINQQRSKEEKTQKRSRLPLPTRQFPDSGTRGFEDRQ